MTDNSNDILAELVGRIQSEDARRAVTIVVTALATMRVGRDQNDSEQRRVGEAALERGVADLRAALAADIALVEQAAMSLATLRDVSLLTFDQMTAARAQALAEALADLARHVQTEAWPSFSAGEPS